MYLWKAWLQMRSLNDLTTRILIHGMKPSDGPEAGEEESGIVYECWAGIDAVRMRDYEQAKANNTMEDLNLFIRDTRGTFIPTNKHTISILDQLYEGRMYNIKSVQPDLQNKRFITIVVGLVT